MFRSKVLLNRSNTSNFYALAVILPFDVAYTHITYFAMSLSVKMYSSMFPSFNLFSGHGFPNILLTTQNGQSFPNMLRIALAPGIDN